LKYGEGLSLKFGDYKLTFARNRDEKDFPEILKKWYKCRTGKVLNLDNPQTLNEKTQWLKLYDNSPLKTRLADKYLVRDWVKEQIGKEYLIPLLGVWNNFDEINFDKLPEKFVLKANHGCAWNVIVKDKSNFNKAAAKKKFDKWMKRNYAYKAGLELQYKDIPPKIIAEQYITDKNGELNDYKVLCFNGEPKFIWIDMGRFKKRTENIYDIDWNLQPFLLTYENSKEPVPPPQNLAKMIEFARKLSKDFAMVRVDFYDVDGKLYFGEMTFTSASGVDKFKPAEYDLKLGQMLELPNANL
ncbi:MAG: glycosyltransferase, partial [Heliobacteriaceae bacterium]|nr:glycosyltransferase [Heliobacteriaceae bacterium]